MTATQTLLDARDLAYGYPGRTLGRDINLAVKAGEALCVLGPNGGGKTTLFRTLLGLLPTHAGAITLGGQPLEARTPAERAKLIAYVPQAGNSYFAFTVRDVVLMGRTAHLGLFAAPGAKDFAAADASLEELRIAHLADKSFTQVSGGERQLALIARALAQESPLLIMDEPTASLDFGNQTLILNEIMRLKASGKSVLFCTHDPDHALQCADRALLLHHGNVLALGRPSEVMTAASLKTLYGVDVELIEGPSHGRTFCRPTLQPS
ncbi:MAG: ABC transporter ATP-binding protein [Betaproteobacteria bacterium]|nr:ABC transporter ATP-binding protein [Betaproteobacteria bacterium]